MSVISTQNVYSDIEKKLTAFLKTNITDPKATKRAALDKPKGSPFIVIGSELQHSQFFPHIIVQCVEMGSNLFAMSSKDRVNHPIVQFSIYSRSKEEINLLKDEMLYDMAVGDNTMQTYGLHKCELQSSGSQPYNYDLKVHGFVMRYSFVYYHMPIS